MSSFGRSIKTLLRDEVSSSGGEGTAFWNMLLDVPIVFGGDGGILDRLLVLLASMEISGISNAGGGVSRMDGGFTTMNGEGKSLDAETNGFTGVVDVIVPVPNCNGASFDPPFNQVLSRVVATADVSASSSEICNEPSDE